MIDDELIGEAHLRHIVESAMDAIITINAEQRIVLFNPAAQQMFRCAATDALGQPIDRFIPQRFRPAHQGHIETFGHTRVTNRRMGMLGTVTGLRADGDEFPAEASISQFDTSTGKFFTVILRDITQRKRAEAALQESEARFKAFMDNSPTIAFLKDTQGHYVYVNRPFEMHLNKPAAHVLGKSVFEVWPSDIAHKLHDHDAKTLVADTTIEHVEVIPDAKGELRQWLVLKFPFRDSSGTRYVGGVGLDITHRKDLEEQLRQTERLAELGTLASGMAHEIGTPMNVILGRAEFLMRKTQEEQTKKGLETIVAQVERITKLMNQLLTFARRRPSERRAMDLRTTVETCLEILSERLARHHVKVDTTIPLDLPPVHADQDQMSQVFLNLFINAVHAMPEGGQLRIAAEPTGNHVTVTVADTGHGIPAEYLTKIFTPFFTTKEVGKGTGLGLTVVHGILQEHGGSITVESQKDQGTAFTLMLPVSPSQ
ncbi:MAG: PAS domain S-box protein [Nitrospirae bacterium]|nr:MAG: PAS domain S-box protein [Nitrospirota bacterium]